VNIKTAVRAISLAVAVTLVFIASTCRLQHAVAGAESQLPVLALVVESDLAFQYVEHLEVAQMLVQAGGVVIAGVVRGSGLGDWGGGLEVGLDPRWTDLSLDANGSCRPIGGSSRPSAVRWLVLFGTALPAVPYALNVLAHACLDTAVSHCRDSAIMRLQPVEDSDDNAQGLPGDHLPFDREARSTRGLRQDRAMQAAGGRFLVRGMPAKVYELGMNERTVVVEFESLAKALATYESPAYQEALRALGKDAVERDMRVVEGTD
jgi:uncharacterized protein (DUF1330 family)